MYWIRAHSWKLVQPTADSYQLAPMIRGWLNYFGKYNRSMVKYMMDCINRSLVKWATCKYKRFRSHSGRARDWLKELAKREPNMFPHWTLGILP
ncbi:group II intron maturase-specific domain-containing protein [Desulfitobacterium sp.]|uniref:group II intron maturase-specific domain-containing protein n=1 Tax=Desulfitobacterium sp. TaxID=49981 RepID=UPI0039C86C73